MTGGREREHREEALVDRLMETAAQEWLCPLYSVSLQPLIMGYKSTALKTDGAPALQNVLLHWNYSVSSVSSAEMV